jgi:hypothetical protein
MLESSHFPADKDRRKRGGRSAFETKQQISTNLGLLAIIRHRLFTRIRHWDVL